jgi:hypothetical protein
LPGWRRTCDAGRESQLFCNIQFFKRYDIVT